MHIISVLFLLPCAFASAYLLYFAHFVWVQGTEWSFLDFFAGNLDFADRCVKVLALCVVFFIFALIHYAKGKEEGWLRLSLAVLSLSAFILLLNLLSLFYIYQVWL